MQSHERYTSESSNTTNSSGCTEQTYMSVSGDDVPSDCANNSETYPGQATGHLGERRNTAAVGFNNQYDVHNGQISRENGFPVPKQNDRIPIRRLQSEVFNPDLGYIPESAPLLRDNLSEWIRVINSQQAELLKLKKNYKSLRRMFLILALLCIVLIICVISVLPVILVSFRMDNNNDKSTSYGSEPLISNALKEFMFGQLHSQRAKGIIRQHVFCSKCTDRGDAYNRESFGDARESECCQESIFSEFTTFKDAFTEVSILFFFLFLFKFYEELKVALCAIFIAKFGLYLLYISKDCHI